MSGPRRGDVMPLKETLDQPETLWVQFRHRLDKLQPFCRIAGHTSAEVQEILATLEMVCRETFPQLNLRQWSEAIYSWLTHPLLDPTGSSRVVMGHLMKLVTTALEWSYEAGETEVSAETLQAAAELLTLGRDTIRLIDGAGPTVAHPSIRHHRTKECARGRSRRSISKRRAQTASLSPRCSGRDAESSAIHKLLVLRTDSTGSGSLVGIDGGSRAMSVVWLCKQGESKRTIGGDFAASTAKVATSAQCYPLDGTGNRVGTRSESRKGTRIGESNEMKQRQPSTLGQALPRERSGWSGEQRSALR